MTAITYYVAWPFVASDGGAQTTRFSGPSPDACRAACSSGHAARCISRYRRWPKPIPRISAFCRREPTVRLVSFDILFTGVRAFE
jgi:hypothetical protein